MSLENTEEVETTENAQSEQEPQEQVDTETPEVEETPTVDDSSTDNEDPDTFPRDYVEKLRDENAKYRQRAQKADEIAHRLHNALTEATGRLQDASDLPYDESHLDDPEALQRAIQELLEKKPHLGSRKPTGNIGQGVSSSTDAVDLAAMMRARA